jgi:YVTN family beta-propeller protein
MRKIVSRAKDLSFACAALAACLFETDINSAPAKVTADTLTLVATVKVGRNPDAMAITPDGKYLYVANFYSNTVSVIDTAVNKVSATIALSPGFGNSGISLAITPDGSSLFVLEYNNSTIAVISTSTNTVLTTFSGGTGLGTGLAITQDGTQLYVANLSGTVSIIDVATYAIENTLTVGSQTFAIGISPDGTFAYVEAIGDAGPVYLTQIDVTSQTIVAPQLCNVIAPSSPTLVFSPDSQTVYVPGDAYEVLALNALTGQLKKTFVLSTEKRFVLAGAQISPDGKSLYVAETTGHAIATVNTTTGKTVATALGDNKRPSAVLLAPSGDYLYVSNHTPMYDDENGTVSVIST